MIKRILKLKNQLRQRYIYSRPYNHLKDLFKFIDK
jgi:hypothetical protein